MSNMFSMGGYAFYVWSSFALAFVIVVWNVWVPLRCEQRLLERIRRQNQRRKV
ncbi:heme exporter protein CcmD [Thiohalomonas denitrificans]|uniref:heme exporter protein CcmD n=1 Tax=Thiohalomonas denitrificans TaxID=415747 RepID=UPI0026EFE983|nr:heme exporter protein CcmD [Thiohalomonas denitrificans]